MQKVIVTGGCGFIGSHLTDELIERGMDVSLIDNLSTGTLKHLHKSISKMDECGIGSVAGDIRNNHFEKCLEGIDTVFHLAAKRSVPESVDNPKEFYETNVMGTTNLMRAAVKHNVKRVVFASSSSIYGIQKGLPFTEDMMPNPQCPYAISKRTAELIMRYYADNYDIETVSLRYFNVIGPRQDLTSKYAMVIPAFITHLMEGTKPIIYGDGTQQRDFSDVFDVVRATIMAAESKKVGDGEVINVSGNNVISVEELLDKLQDMMGTDIEPIHADKRKGDVPITWADTTKANKLLGYEPICELDYSLENCINYLEGLK